MNILIVGLGSIAAKHINALKGINGNINLYALRSGVSSGNIEGITNTYDLNDLNVTFDFAIISNPTHLHYEFIGKLAKRNIPLFIEKPAVHSLQNVNELVDIIEGKQLITYVACNLRFHPCLQFLKRALDENPARRVNEVNVYSGSYLPDWRPGRNFKEIYSANPEMGGGVHLDLFHELDYTYWLFGKPDNTIIIKRNASSLNIAAIDYANYILEYKEFTANIILNYYRKDARRTIEILFEDETWCVDLIKNIITGKDDAVIFSDSSFSILKTYTDQMDYFINSLRTGKKQMNTFAESVEVLKLCLNNE